MALLQACVSILIERSGFNCGTRVCIGEAGGVGQVRAMDVLISLMEAARPLH